MHKWVACLYIAVAPHMMQNAAQYSKSPRCKEGFLSQTRARWHPAGCLQARRPSARRECRTLCLPHPALTPRWSRILRLRCLRTEKDIDVMFFKFPPAGQRTLHHRSDVLETVVLVNPSEDTVVSEVSQPLRIWFPTGCMYTYVLMLRLQSVHLLTLNRLFLEIFLQFC